MNKLRLAHGDCVGLIACSDGIQPEDQYALDGIVAALAQIGLSTKLAKTIFQCHGPFSGTPEERAQELMALFCDTEIKAIFDLSGGDTANQILPYLDYPRISQQAKSFFGISDVSVILNAIYTRAQIPTYYYRIRNLSGEYADEQQHLFQRLFFTETDDFATFDHRWLHGTCMSGIVVGGNIRCFLKLVGTPYLPDPTGKLLFLESLGGGPNRIASLLAQLEQIGYLAQCAGLILGTFTDMEAQKLTPSIEELVLEVAYDLGLPIVKSNQLGHGTDAHCLPIGREMTLK